MLYVHPVKFNLDEISAEEQQKIIDNYNPSKEDPAFFKLLYERKVHDDKKDLKMRDGIAPITKNIRNIRFKRKPKFDIDQVRKIETMLKDHIDFGFADHVDEQLLHFDDDGVLKDITDGKSNQKKAVENEPAFSGLG